MLSSLKFRISNSPSKLLELYSLCGTEWGGKLSPKQFAEVLTANHQRSIELGENPNGFYFEDEETGNVVATAIVSKIKGFHKDADRSLAISSVPDPGLFGVRNITFLFISNVFTHKDYRNKGLAKSLIEKAIEFTEDDIVQGHIDLSDAKKNDSFKSMTVSDGKVDKQLADYYLGKQYFWVLYSGVKTYYERFGFKPFPLEFYKVPTSILADDQEALIKNLINKAETNDPSTTGKHLRLLHGSKKQDQDLIQFIFQNKELEILTELNKLIFHSELAGTYKSSSSITNLSSVLQMSKLGSNSALSAITETDANKSKETPLRRKSSVHQLSVPKIAFKPDYNNFTRLVSLEHATAKVVGTDDAIRFTDIQGAIFTNDLQQKSYYIIWSTFKLQTLTILGMGELKMDMFANLADPTGMGGAPRSRRGSSFGGINELGGFNFQDLDILLNVACYVSKNRPLPNHDSVYVSVNDTPSNIPAPVLHDYFLNYLPKTFDKVNEPKDDSSKKSTRVEFITDADTHLGILPMIKKFGSTSPEFELDWNSSGLWSWG